MEVEKVIFTIILKMTEHSKTSQELRKAALRISHRLSRCPVVFTK